MVLFIYLFFIVFLNFQMSNDIEHLFKCLFTIPASSVVRCPNLLPLFKIGLFVFLWLNLEVSYIFWVQVLYQVYALQIFSLIMACLFILLNSAFCRAEVFNAVHFICSFTIVLLVSDLRNLCLMQGHKGLFLEVFTILCFIFLGPRSILS